MPEESPFTPPPAPKYPELIAAVLVERDGKYLLREETMNNGKRMWIVPGGHVEFGETLEAAALREITEETGLKVSLVRFLGHKEAIFPSSNYHTVVFFYLGKAEGGEIVSEKGEPLEFLTPGEMRARTLVPSAEWLLKKEGII